MLQDALNTYWGLCGTGGQLLGYFFGAIFLATVCAMAIVALYVFMRAFFEEIRK